MPFPTSFPPSRIALANEAPSVRWGILGSGWIAERFIDSVRAHTKQDLVAVGPWRQNLAQLVLKPPQITAGEVVAHKAK